MLKRILLLVGPPLIRAYTALLRLTCRIRITGENGLPGLPAPGGTGRFYAFWHCHLLICTRVLSAERPSAIVSRSGDGEIIARILARWGYACIRGSSTRGFVAVYRETVEALKRGGKAVITPDGPRGPLETVNPGIIRMAATTGADIVPVGAGYSRRRRLASWDRFSVPFPFSRITVLFGAPYRVGGGEGEAWEKAAETDLRARLNAVTAKAQASVSP